MTSARDIASVILERKGAVDEMKLHKLVYYCQAWHLAWHGTPLFDEPIQAWQWGPVLPALRYSRLEPATEAEAGLSERAVKVLDHVLQIYGRLTAGDLSKATHVEYPYVEARLGLTPNAPSQEEIKPETMARYYSRLTMNPAEAAAYAAANARAEGVDISREAQAELEDVAAGRLTAEDAVQRLLNQYVA